MEQEVITKATVVDGTSGPVRVMAEVWQKLAEQIAALVPLDQALTEAMAKLGASTKLESNSLEILEQLVRGAGVETSLTAAKIREYVAAQGSAAKVGLEAATAARVSAQAKMDEHNAIDKSTLSVEENMNWWKRLGELQIELDKTTREETGWRNELTMALERQKSVLAEETKAVAADTEATTANTAAEVANEAEVTKSTTTRKARTSSMAAEKAAAAEIQAQLIKEAKALVDDTEAQRANALAVRDAAAARVVSAQKAYDARTTATPAAQAQSLETELSAAKEAEIYANQSWVLSVHANKKAIAELDALEKQNATTKRTRKAAVVEDTVATTQETAAVVSNTAATVANNDAAAATTTKKQSARAAKKAVAEASKEEAAASTASAAATQAEVKADEAVIATSEKKVRTKGQNRTLTIEQAKEEEALRRQAENNRLQQELNTRAAKEREAQEKATAEAEAEADARRKAKREEEKRRADEVAAENKRFAEEAAARQAAEAGSLEANTAATAGNTAATTTNAQAKGAKGAASTQAAAADASLTGALNSQTAAQVSNTTSVQGNEAAKRAAAIAEAEYMMRLEQEALVVSKLPADWDARATSVLQSARASGLSEAMQNRVVLSLEREKAATLAVIDSTNARSLAKAQQAKIDEQVNTLTTRKAQLEANLGKAEQDAANATDRLSSARAKANALNQNDKTETAIGVRRRLKDAIQDEAVAEAKVDTIKQAITQTEKDLAVAKERSTAASTLTTRAANEQTMANSRLKVAIDETNASLKGATVTSSVANERMAVLSGGMAAGERPLAGLIMGLTGLTGGSFALVAGLLAGALAFKAVTEAAVDWQSKLQTVQNNTILTTEETTKMGEEVRAMARDLGGNMDEMAAGYQSIASLSYRGAEAQEILRSATMSAVSTQTNQADVVNSLSTVMREYNLSGSHAAVVMDLLHNAAAQGNMTLTQFTDGGRRAIATAANLGVGMEEATAAFAALTRHGYDAAQAGTQVTNVMVRIVHPTQQAQKAIEELSKTSGVDLVGDFSLAGIQAKGLSGVLQDVSRAVGNDREKIFDLIPALRGGQGALVLAGIGAKDFTQILESQTSIIQGKYTPTLDAMERTQQTFGNTLGVTAAKFRDAAIEIGTALLPMLTSLLKILQPVADALKFLGDVLGFLLTPINSVIEADNKFAESIKHTADVAMVEAQRLATGFDQTAEALRTGLGEAAKETALLVDGAFDDMAGSADKLDDSIKHIVEAYSRGNKQISDKQKDAANDARGNVIVQANIFDRYRALVEENLAAISQYWVGGNNEQKRQEALAIQLRWGALNEEERIAVNQKMLLSAGINVEKMSKEEIITTLRSYINARSLLLSQNLRDGDKFVGQQAIQWQQLLADERGNIASAIAALRQYQADLRVTQNDIEDMRAAQKAGPATGGTVNTETAEEAGKRLKAIFDEVAKDTEKGTMTVISSLTKQAAATKSKLDDIAKAQQAASQMGGAFSAAMSAYYDDMGKAAQKSADELTNAIANVPFSDIAASVEGQLAQMGSIIGDKGMEAGADFAVNMLEQLRMLPPGVQAELQGVITYLDTFIQDMQAKGYIAGAGHGSGVEKGLADYQALIDAQFNNYATSADMAQLFQKLGIQTGDTWGANINAGVAAWFDQFKANLMAYMEAAKVAAAAAEKRMIDSANRIADLARAMGGTPGSGSMFAEADALKAAASRVQGELSADLADAEAKLASIKATVDKQKAAAIAAHDEANKKKGGSGPSLGDLQRAADAADRAFENARDSYEAAMQKHLEYLIQLSLEEDVTRTTKDLSDAQAIATRHTKEFKAAQQELNDQLRKNSAEEARATVGLQAIADAYEKAFDDMKKAHEETLHSLDVDIHHTEGVLKELERESEGWEKPLEEGADKAKKALEDLNEETRLMDLAFTRQLEHIADLQYAFEETAKTIMGPYNDAVNAATAATEAQQAVVDAINTAVEAQQDVISKLADKYANELFPIQQRLAELQRQQADDTRAKQLGDEAQQVGNLNARIRNATENSREWLALVKQRDEANRKLGQDVEIDKLTKQQDKISAERDAALKAANDKLKLLQAEQKTANDQLKVMQEQQKMAEKARDDQAKLLDAQRAVYEEQAKNIQHEQELYDRQQREKAEAAQQDVNRAEEALTKQKELDAAREKSTREQLERQKNEREDLAYSYSEAERLEGLLVEAKKKAVEDAKKPFEETRDRISTINGLLSEQNRLQAEDDQRTVDTAKALNDVAKDNLKMYQDNKQAADEATKWANAQADWFRAIEAHSDKLANVAEDLPKVKKGSSELAASLKNELNPAMKTLNTEAAPAAGEFYNMMEGVFGTPSQANTGKLTKLMQTHNPQGFWAYLESQTKLALGSAGLQTVWSSGLATLFEGVAGDVTANQTVLDKPTYDMGVYIIDGIAKGAADADATSRLGAAIKKAIDDAIADAQKHADIQSPSGLTARKLGEPLGMGLPMGVERTKGALATSLRNTITQGVAGAGAGGVGGAAGHTIINLNGNLSFPMPNATKLPTDPNAYRDAARAISIAIAHEASMSQYGAIRR